MKEGTLLQKGRRHKLDKGLRFQRLCLWNVPSQGLLCHTQQQCDRSSLPFLNSSAITCPRAFSASAMLARCYSCNGMASSSRKALRLMVHLPETLFCQFSMGLSFLLRLGLHSSVTFTSALHHNPLIILSSPILFFLYNIYCHLTYCMLY